MASPDMARTNVQLHLPGKFLHRFLSQHFRAAPVISTKAPVWLLVTSALLFSLCFIAASVQLHGVFYTAAYDLGLFDQAFWRYSQFLSPFNTVRGMNILGDHFSPIALVFAPLYRIWADITWAFILQTISVAAGGILLFAIARDLFPKRSWLALAVAGSYYLHPAVHNTLLWQYHELVLASGLYMALIWSYLRDRLRVFVPVLVLLLACREDMPFTLAAFGALALIEKRWRYAAWAILLSLAWWLIATRIAMPYFNGVGYFRHTDGVLSTLFANLANPAFYLRRLLDPQSLLYLFQILLPAGLLGVFAPRYLLPALPTLAANILIGRYNIHIDYHYSVSIMPFLFWASLMSMKKMESMPRQWHFTPRQLQSAAAGLLLAASFGLSLQYSVMKLRDFPAKYQAWQAASPKRAMLKNLHREFGNGGVAASDFLLPHLSHRESIYLFPNPWKAHYWGIAEKNPHHPNQVQHIVISPGAMRQHERLVDYLIGKEIFEKTADEHGVIVLKRIRPEVEDRDEAVNAYLNYSPLVPPAFSNIMVSRPFPTQKNEFGRLHIDLAAPSDAFPSADLHIPQHRPGEIMSLPLAVGMLGKSDFMTRYVRAELFVDKPTLAHLDLGSDDGITVWVNQEKVHENIVMRPANLEDDRVAFELKKGKNVIVFRVNNATGGWKLMARIRAQRCLDECESQTPS